MGPSCQALDLVVSIKRVKDLDCSRVDGSGTADTGEVHVQKQRREILTSHGPRLDAKLVCPSLLGH